MNCAEYEGYQFSRQSYMCFTTCKTINCTCKLRTLVARKLAQLEQDLASGKVLPEEVYGGDRAIFKPPRPNTHRNKWGNSHNNNGVPVPFSNLGMAQQLKEIMAKL